MGGRDGEEGGVEGRFRCSCDAYGMRSENRKRSEGASLHPVPSHSLAVVLYDGQRTEHATTDSYFEILYWRMRKLFKVSAVALFFTVLQVRHMFFAHHEVHVCLLRCFFPYS